MEVIKERRRLRERVVEEARQWALSLPFKATAILVGSYARGDFNLWSDVDVLLVADFKEPPPRRLINVKVPPGFEVIPVTPSELRRLIDRGDALVVEALRRGVVLRDDLKLSC
mgnify:CR=1 FL=1